MEVLKGSIEKALPCTQRMIIEFHRNEDRDLIIAFANESGFNFVFQKQLLLFFSRM